LTVNPGTLVEDIPTEYRVEISETPLKLKVFSLDGSGRMAIEGTVKNSCTVMAQRNDQYSRMLKQRLVKSMIKTRYDAADATSHDVGADRLVSVGAAQNRPATRGLASREARKDPVHD
jgi:pantothenate kinase type III